MGTWIDKKEPSHYCRQPDPGDHYDRQFGHESVWQCDCGLKWIFLNVHPFFADNWERLDRYEANQNRKASDVVPFVVQSASDPWYRRWFGW